MADSNLAFREIESFNLFSQGNIYTTKVMKQRKSPPEMDLGTQPTSILVGTLKPAKILNIIPKKTYTNESIEENENEDKHGSGQDWCLLYTFRITITHVLALNHRCMTLP